MFHKKFPRYTDFTPMVPVICATPNRPSCIHRFFDTSPISPSGRYLAVFQLPFEDRRAKPGESGNICLIDLISGEDRIIAQSCGWEPQLGANINWGGSDNELFFNDVDTASWQPYAWKVNPHNGERQKMEGTVYHASPDGRWLISANTTTMRKTQPGYGVQIPDEKVRQNIGASEEDGFYITDTLTGKRKLFVSIAGIFDNADPPVQMDDLNQYEIYGFHSKFNPAGDRLMLSLRWFPKRDRRTFDMFKLDFNAVRYAWVVMPLSGESIHCTIGPEQWEKGGHHATWYPDGNKISMNLNIHRDGLRFVSVNADGSKLKSILDKVPGSGHPTFYIDGSHLLTDTYTNEMMAYGDGTIPLRWIDIRNGSERRIVRINTKQSCSDDVMRVDSHPAWDRTWRYVVFNAVMDNTRRVFIADMKELLS